MREYVRLFPLVFNPALARQVGEAVIQAAQPLLHWHYVLEPIREDALARILVPYAQYGIAKEGGFLWETDALEFLRTNYLTSVLALTNLEVLQEDGTMVYGCAEPPKARSRQKGKVLISAYRLFAEGEPREEKTLVEKIVSQALHEIGEISGLEEHMTTFPEVNGKLCPMVMAKSFMEATDSTSTDYLKKTGLKYCQKCKEELFQRV